MKKISFLTALFMGGFAQFSNAQTFVSQAQSTRNAVLQEFTGIHCTWCPAGHLIANNMKAAAPNNVVLINVHAGGFATPGAGEPDLRSAISTALDNASDLSGYPAGDINRRLFTDSEPEIAAGRGVWQSRATAVRNLISPVNVAARCTINLDNRQLRMTVEAYYTGNGNGTQDRFNAFILQNNIEGPQTGSFRNPAQVLPNGNYVHNHALRAALTPTWGDVVSSISQGSFYTNRYTATIPANYNNVPALLGDLEVAVFMTDSTMDTYTGNMAEIYYETATPLNVQSLAVANNLTLNTACGNTAEPTLTFTNMGSSDITSITIQYTNNGGAPVTETITLTTPVPTAGRVTANIPNVALSNGANALSFTVTQINGTAYTGNAAALNTTINTAGLVSSASDSLILNILFDQYPEEVSYTLRNETANTVVSSVTFTNAIPDGAARRYAFPLIDGNCYSFEMKDAAGDGICCGYGQGNFTLSTGATNIITSNGQYAAGTGSKFNWSRVVGIQPVEEAAQAVRLYPNPVKENFTLEFELAEAADMNISISNALGQTIREIQNGNMNAGSHQLTINSNELPNGTYFVTFRQDGKMSTKRFNVMR